VYDYLARRYGLNIKSVHWEPDVPPTDAQWSEIKTILTKHPAQWMVWEAKPMQESVERLKLMGIDSLIFDPCANTPDQGDFLSVMQQNAENLETVFQ
jgi:zinc transport system substrate-binding protein